MWIELVVAVCLYSDPAACRELHFQFVPAQSLRRCMADAQPYLANWSVQHREWQIVRWHCAYPSDNERRA